MECPVCKSITSNQEKQKCNVCNADLEIFTLLDKIHKREKKYRRLLILLILLLLVMLGGATAYYFYFFTEGENRTGLLQETISRQQVEIQTLTNEKQLLMTSVIELRREVEKLRDQLEKASDEASVATAPKPGFREIVHIVKRGENLKKIAQRYYGDSDEYVRIMRDNNISNPNRIRINQRLRIRIPMSD